MFWKTFVCGLILSFGILAPLGTKWQIDKKVRILAALCIGLWSGAIAGGVAAFWNLTVYQALLPEILLITTTAAALLLWRFFRDPERTPPNDENAILSPADGMVIYVKRIEEGEIPFSEKKGRKYLLTDFAQADALPRAGYLIGISMNFLDVHVNRAPISGKVKSLKRIKGLFISLRAKEAILQNERMVSIIDNGHFKVGIVQIASRLVRRIVTYMREGYEVQKGERIGAIRFGSQVDLILPDLPSLRIEAVCGDKVNAGVSVIASFHLREEIQPK